MSENVKIPEKIINFIIMPRENWRVELAAEVQILLPVKL